MKDDDYRLNEEQKKEAMEVLRACSPEDFDGHVDWHALTFEQKLQWISTSARIWQEWGGVLREDQGKYKTRLDEEPGE